MSQDIDAADTVTVESNASSPDSGIATSLDEVATLSTAEHVDRSHRPRSRRQLDIPDEPDSLSSLVTLDETTSATPTVTNEHLSDPWFLAHSSWQIHPSPGNSDFISFTNSGLECFITTVRRWLDQWIKEGYCALIHPRLYGNSIQLPDCLRDAYTAYQTYCAATLSNKSIAMQIVSSSAKRLVENQSLLDDLDAAAVDIQTHLSRTQALLIFQIVRLFDGDIRSRADAETASDTLLRWSYQLMQKAASISITNRLDPRVSSDDGSQQRQSPKRKENPDAASLHSDGTASSLWRAWIFSECIRRTWITATLVEAAYSILKHGVTACPGNIEFTSQAGLWQASSPREWVSRLREKGNKSVKEGQGFPLTCAQVPGLLAGTQPKQVDDFTHALIVYSVGQEEWNDWVTDANESAPSLSS